MRSLFIIILALGIFYIGYSSGSNNTELKYQIKLNESNSLVNELMKANIEIEREYYTNVSDLRIQLEKVKENFNNKINSNNHANIERLQQSESRAKYYREQAKACSLESRNLAEHTAELDRQLTKGIGLVEELTGLIKLRDEQLRNLGKQLHLDRELNNGK